MKLHKNKKINILHNIYSIDKSIGGPIFSMRVLAEAQVELGHEVTVIAGQSKNHINPVKLNKKVNLILVPAITKYRYMKNWESNILDLNISKKDKKSKYYKIGLSCPKCYDKLTSSQITRFTVRHNQLLNKKIPLIYKRK